MKTIGITGGVGAGKSQILAYIEKHCRCRILPADDAAHLVQEPGGPCYEPLIRLLGKEVLGPEGQIRREKMAGIIFRDQDMLKKVNAIVHPAVKKYILSAIEEERQNRRIDAFFVEAALLIEDGYGQLLDELWYIYARKDVRKERLRLSRGYSPEKIGQIFSSQLSEGEFLAHCKVVIDNSGSLSDTYRKVDEILKEAGLYR